MFHIEINEQKGGVFIETPAAIATPMETALGMKLKQALSKFADEYGKGGNDWKHVDTPRPNRNN